VASGDPTHDSVVLWTRLVPEPLAPGGGMPPKPATVLWELAEDEDMRRVVRRGVQRATPELGHSVHAEPRGLRPGREYWYRFRLGDHVSDVGRTKTLPHPRSRPAAMLFAFASCQDYETAYYTAYHHLVRDSPDLVFHLGDYIYERPPDDDGVRVHVNPEPTDLDAYRLRHAQYKTDPDLRAAHAAAPFVCTWDDHDTKNDYAGDIPQPWSDPVAFHRRRAAAYQAFYEHLPLRRPRRIEDWARFKVYRQFQVGDLATFSVLDTRQYRDDHPCDIPDAYGNVQVDERCTERHDPARTLLGAQQRTWLLDGLSGSSTRWNVIAQQCLFAELDHKPGPGGLWEVDAWDGYTADRRAILERVRDAGLGNVVTVSGDLHAHLVNDLRLDFADPESTVLATELVGTAISSRSPDDVADLRPDNPHVKFASQRRGYVRVRLGRDELRADMRSLDGTDLPAGTPCTTEASFVVERGRPGAQLD
jgi:alkaline phosphatase D